MASAVGSTALAAQAPAGGGSWTNACGLSSNEEFQTVYEVDPRIGIIPDDPVQRNGVGTALRLLGQGNRSAKKTPSAG
jgi:hypothetical protein